ncbi:MAG: hypothetical protein GX963_05645, partial [Bacteroidales bacterium]|nr:hypothetical protein [Bacteroidales bacterium]
MERCGFFDANLVGEEYDRVYLASQFAAYFASFIGNGVFAKHSNQLQVVEMETPQMQAGVERGQAWINGYWYENTDIFYLPIDIADGVLNRIDSVVLRFGLSERNIWLTVKKGTPALNPVAPKVTRTADYYELQLATISIPAGSIKITQAQITDTRMNQEVCGWVTGVIDQVDTTTLFNQYVDWYTTTTGQAETDIEAIKQQFQNDLTQFEQDWNDWFSQQQTEGFVMAVEKGQPNGIATLDENGKIPNEQLPEIEASVTSVNGQTGDVVLTADDVGAETPTGAQAKLDAHNSQSNAHGATSAATANKIIMRDSAGRAKVAAPSASDDIARKDTVDNHAGVTSAISTLGHVYEAEFTATIATASWSGTTPPYSNAVTVNGIT